MRGVWCWSVLLVICALQLSGCGLRLQGSAPVADNSKRILVTGLPRYNPFVRQLNEVLTQNGGQVVKTLDLADIVLTIVDERRNRREISLSQKGKANEYELTYELAYEISNPAGASILPEQKIRIARPYFNPQIQVLGKANEEEMIWRDIYKEAVSTVLRRLQLAPNQASVPAKK